MNLSVVPVSRLDVFCSLDSPLSFQLDAGPWLLGDLGRSVLNNHHPHHRVRFSALGRQGSQGASFIGLSAAQ